MLCTERDITEFPLAQCHFSESQEVKSCRTMHAVDGVCSVGCVCVWFSACMCGVWLGCVVYCVCSCVYGGSFRDEPACGPWVMSNDVRKA